MSLLECHEGLPSSERGLRLLLRAASAIIATVTRGVAQSG